MKKIIFFVCLMLGFSNCEKPGDCVKSTGSIVSKQFDGLTFNKIIVNKGISLEITQGDVYKVEVRTGENLINDIQVTVVGDMLVLEDMTSCNWVRDYGQTIVYVTAPNLTDIYCKTEKEIKSNGVLRYQSLHVVSGDSADGYNGAGMGDIALQLHNESVTIECNNVSRFFLSGTTTNLSVNFYEGGGIFYGENMIAEKVHVFHRGSNDMFVHPINEINGDIYNIGNVYSLNHPPIVNVIEHYQGRLIFY